MTLSRIFEHARHTPDKTAIVCDGVSSSYAHFARCIEACRRYFAQQGLPVGAVAVIDVQHLLDAWIIGLALRSIGMTTLAVRNASDIGMLRVRNVGCVVTTAAENRPAPQRGPGETPWRSIRVPFDVRAAEPPDAPAESGATVVRPGGHSKAIPPSDAAAPHAGGHITMTSGTTGAYKKVVRDAHAEALSIPFHAEINGIAGDSIVYIGNFDLWTAGGYRWPLITWHMGGTVVIHHGPDMHTPLAQHDLTHIFATPGTLATLLRAADGMARRNDATRLLVTGGAMSQAMLAAAQQQLTRRVYSVFASTEVLTVAVTPLDSPDDLNWHRIHPSREVQVVDDVGNTLGPGHEGAVRIRIIDGLAGYLDEGEATREFFRDGWFHPGDVGLFGADGRLSLRGRESDVINLFGDKIATGPIEQALQDRLGVDGVCVLTVTDANGSDAIYVVIQSSRPLDSAAIGAARNAELALFRKMPVHAVAIAKLPRNAMGKVERLALKRQLVAALADKSRRG
jgi:acyl-coenzyme A synthetase/AMP-(fatty) acid ligase